MGSSVRTRALVHMKAMLATSAAVATANEACHPKPNGTDGGTDATAFGPPRAPDASDTVVVNDVPDANTTTVERDHGYMVVDPVPRPAYCASSLAHMKGKAVRTGSNITITLPAPAPVGGESLKFTSGTQPTVYGGTLVSSTVTEKSASIVFTPATKDADVSIGVHASCGSRGLMTVNASVNTANLAVTVLQY